jgi:hypothetical protein
MKETHNISVGLDRIRLEEYLICCENRWMKVRKNRSFNAIRW